MLSRQSSLDDFKNLIRQCLTEMYNNDELLFQSNGNKGISERCFVFRFAHYLQNRVGEYFVDCDFNSSYEGSINNEGNISITRRSGKPIENQDGTVTERMIDIIVHKRDFSELKNDLICFEIKKWSNSNSGVRKDLNNLIKLTSSYGYLYGFHLILGKTRSQTKWSIYQTGQEIEHKVNVF